MTDSNDNASKGGNRPTDAPGQKRPHATLDLKAIEVKEAAEARAASETAASALAGNTTPKSEGVSAAASTASKATATGAPTPPADAKSDVKPADAAKSASMASASKSAESAKPADGLRHVAPVPRSGGFGRFVSHLAAGLAGGFIALAGGDQITAYFGLPGRGAEQSSATSELQKRLAALEQSAKSASGDNGLAGSLAETEARLAKVEEANAAIGSLQEEQSKLAAEAKSLSDRVSETSGVERIAKLEERLSTLSAAAETDGEKGRIQGLAAITGKLSDLEASVANQIAALRKSIPQEVEGRLGPVAESSEAAKTGTQRLDRDLAAVKTDAARLNQRVEAMKADADRSATTLRVLQEEQGTLTSALNDLRGSVEAQLKSVARPADVSSALAPVASKLTQLEQNLQGVVKGEEDRKVNAERIVVSLELANLKRALDQGQKYASELQEVKAASGGRLDLSALDRYKETGVPTLADLQKEFRPVIHAILDAETEPADGSVLDRLVAGAKSVVRVRKVSHSTDDKSAEAIVSRIETALETGRLADAINETNSLPEQSRGAANEWLSKVEARQSVDRTIAAIEGQLKASLSGGAPAAKSEAGKQPPPTGKDQN